LELNHLDKFLATGLRLHEILYPVNVTNFIMFYDRVQDASPSGKGGIMSLLPVQTGNSELFSC